MHARWPRIKRVLKDAWDEWKHDNAMMLAAAVAFYATFSLAPLLLLLLRAGAAIFGRAAARAQMLELVRDTAGANAARAVARVLAAASENDGGATAMSILLLLIASSAVFRHLKQALNLVLDVPTQADRGVVRFLKNRAFAALMALTGIVLVVGALGATAVLAWMRARAPQAIMRAVAVWRVAELLVSFAVLMLVFASILKFVPDIRMKWRHVAAGASLAALAFTAGQSLISVYVSRTSFSSSYGAAGSVVLLLLYVYFAAAVILAAAELTEVLARADRDFRSDRRRLQDRQQYQPRKTDDCA